MAGSIAGTSMGMAEGWVPGNIEGAWGSLMCELSEKVSGSDNGGFWAVLSSLQKVLVSLFGHRYFGNEYFVGSLGVMLMTFMFASAKKVVYRAAQFIVNFWNSQQISVYVPEDSEVHKWVSEWLACHCTRMTTKWNLECDWEEVEDDDGAGEDELKPQLLFVPNLKKEAIAIKYRGKDISFEIECKEKSDAGGAGGGDSEACNDVVASLVNARSKSSLLIQAQSRSVIEELVKEAMEVSYEKLKTKTKTVIYRWDTRREYWSTVAIRPVRKKESLILNADFDKLVADAREFIRGRDWYRCRGVPYRRGYLLHGPPGTGKSSTILVLAGLLKLDLSIIGLSDKNMDDENLRSALNLAPIRSILVLEDIDAAFSGRRSDDARSNSLSFSGLLNAIDGVAAQEGKLLVMTTNYVDRLDPALIRPGRCDLKMYLGLADRMQTVGMFRRFYPDAPVEKAEAFGRVVPECTATPASLQSYFLERRNNSEAALTEVPQLLEELQKKGNTNKAPLSSSSSSSSSSSPSSLAAARSADAGGRGKETTIDHESETSISDDSDDDGGTTVAEKDVKEVDNQQKQHVASHMPFNAELLAQQLTAGIIDLVKAFASGATRSFPRWQQQQQKEEEGVRCELTTVDTQSAGCINCSSSSSPDGSKQCFFSGQMVIPSGSLSSPASDVQHGESALPNPPIDSCDVRADLDRHHIVAEQVSSPTRTTSDAKPVTKVDKLMTVTSTHASVFSTDCENCPAVKIQCNHTSPCLHQHQPCIPGAASCIGKRRPCHMYTQEEVSGEEPPSSEPKAENGFCAVIANLSSSPVSSAPSLSSWMSSSLPSSS